MRQADVYLYDRRAGRLTEDETGYTFRYDAEYLNEAPVRLKPAGKRFRAHNLLGQGSEDRLKPGSDHPVSESRMKPIFETSFHFLIHICQPFINSFNPFFC